MLQITEKTGSEIALLIRNINMGITKNLRGFLKEQGLTPPQMIIIRMLAEHKQLKVSELSKKIGLANSTVSGIVNRLETQGFIKRERSSDDKRVVYLELSDHAKKLHHKLHGSVTDILDDMLQDASHEEIDEIVSGLRKLQQLLEK